MNLINFQNNTTQANADTMNQFQTNIENAIDEIFESGSNQYGYYIKFGDGTMICCREISVTLDVSNAWGSLYYGQDATEWTFAKTFSEVPKVLCSIRNTSSNSCMQIGYNAPVITKSSYKNIAVARPTANSSVSVIVTIFAIGRWK